MLQGPTGSAAATSSGMTDSKMHSARPSASAGAAVHSRERGPELRSSDHPPATLQCEQLRLPVMLRWLVGFGTILSVLAMLILHTASRCQVLFPLTARPACTQPRLTARCAPCAVGACLPLPFNHHTTRATWLGSATTCSRAGACPVHHVHRGVCGTLPRAPPMMTGGGSTSTPCCVALWLS